MTFKDRHINKNTSTIVIDIKMQSELVRDQSRMLVNNSLVGGKGIQDMENKIGKLNKKIEQVKAKVAQKDKIMVGLKNENNDLLDKMDKKRGNMIKIFRNKRLSQIK